MIHFEHLKFLNKSLFLISICLLCLRRKKLMSKRKHTNLNSSQLTKLKVEIEKNRSKKLILKFKTKKK
jgi:hypothetical protein